MRAERAVCMLLLGRTLPSAIAILSACAGPVRPAVMQNMENLPTDPQRRSEQLDSQAATPSAESRKKMSPRMRATETAAATAAALIGAMFSSAVPGSDGPGFLFGAAAPTEEMQLLEDKPKKKDAKKDRDAPDGDAPEGDGKPLVPWIKIEPEAPP
jgi:hypothetical protein